MTPTIDRHPLSVPFKDKDLAKAAGARWDKETKTWFAPAGSNMEDLAKWDPKRREAKPLDLSKLAFALDFPFEAKDEAKAVGAKWDPVRKAWFAPIGKEDGLAQWKVKPALSISGERPEEVLAEALRSAGLDAPTPIMDGKIHRVPLIGGKKGNRDGAYAASDGDDAHGFVQNHVTGLKAGWSCGRADRAAMSPSHRAAWDAQMTLVKAQTDAEREAGHASAAAEATARWDQPGDADPADHPYLARKVVGAYGVKSMGGNLVIPARDADGKLWTLQTIPTDSDGKKLFMKGGRKTGCFHLIGAETVKQGGSILIAEGYATGASLYEATGLPVAIAFDAGNLMAVGLALAAKRPDCLLAFMADNDRHGPVNTGVEKATAAAQAVKGAVIAPDFGALPGKLTDWNDLACAAGHEAARAQALEGLATERARLFQEAADAIKAESRFVSSNWKDGRAIGTARLVGAGLLSIKGMAGETSLHECRRLRGPVSDGDQVALAYKEGKADIEPMPMRAHPDRSAPTR